MNSQNLILLVVNPIAGGTEKENIISLIKSAVSLNNLRLQIFKTTGDNDRQNLNNIIKKNNPSRILVAGGDGTVTMVAECIMDTEICLGIIPAGSANGMAVNLGIPTELSEQIAVALSDNIMRIDSVFINDRLCLHIADLGINAELIKNYEGSSIRGKMGYFLQSIPTIFNSDSPFHFSIETSGGTFAKTGVLLAIANANKFGTGANINPDGKINDGKFEILIFKNLDVFEILKTTQESPELSDEFVEVISTDNATISNKDKVPFQIDGEYIGEIDKIKVTIDSESLCIAVPETFLNSYNITKT